MSGRLGQGQPELLVVGQPKHDAVPAQGPVSEGMGGPAFGLQGWRRPSERPTSCGVKLFGSPLVFPLLVFPVFVFIGESLITYGVLKCRNPLG